MGYSFEIIDFLKDEGILGQKLLVNTPKRTDEITPVGPQAFNSIGMHFIDAIPIFISGPFSVTVPYRQMFSVCLIKGSISVGFIGIDGRLRKSSRFNQGDDGVLLSIGTDFQAQLMGLTADLSDQRGRSVSMVPRPRRLLARGRGGVCFSASSVGPL